jgi:ribonucleoside-diphosphate reductase alpha subunit
MKVLKRSEKYEDMKFDKVTARISKLTSGLSPSVSADKVAQQVFSSMYDGITTQEIDSLTAEIAVAMVTHNVEYSDLANRIMASNIQKQCPDTFAEAFTLLCNQGILVNPCENTDIIIDLSKYIVSDRDDNYGYFGLKTLERSYLMRETTGKLVETPQYMWMRVALGIHGSDVRSVKDTYDLMSQGYMTHATPTLFNSCTPNPQMSSCFLLAMKDDSIKGIYQTLEECAHISKFAGGIGLHAHNVRSRGSKIRGTNGVSDGIIPMLRVFNATARYVNQAGRRKGSFAIYLEPWHKDVMDFLQLRLNQGDEEARCRDLFTAMWIPDLFMRRVEAREHWTLMCPDECPGLSDCYGDEFDQLYERYERDGRGQRVDALDVWMMILKSQIETGTPYMLSKDSINKKSNQKNVGIIKSSNLCTEITEISDPEHTAVCNLGSVALSKFVDIERNEFKYQELCSVVKQLTYNLNKVIDCNYYPVDTARHSNMKMRPIGIGVQGLADVYMMLRLPFDSEGARDVNRRVFETIYYGALVASCDLAKRDGAYEEFKGSPASRGILQFDMWGVEPSSMYDWAALKNDIQCDGLRNSLLVAPMPTATTAQILGNNEAFEPYTTNIYLRRTLAGEFVVVNRHLMKELEKLNLWTPEMKNAIIRDEGSVQNIPDIPDDIKAIYKTAWELSQKAIIDQAADRGAFVDQSQSMNVFVENPTIGKLSSMHMYSWKRGLKTLSYYVRTRAKARAQQVTVEPEVCVSCSG